MASFFYRDNTENIIEAFRTALFKRGRPDRLYFDNGSNYTSREILQACLRLGIRLSHAPVRDGAANGKIERFFRGFRDRFLTQHVDFETLDELNEKTHMLLDASLQIDSGRSTKNTVLVTTCLHLRPLVDMPSHSTNIF